MLAKLMSRLTAAFGLLSIRAQRQSVPICPIAFPPRRRGRKRKEANQRPNNTNRLENLRTVRRRKTGCHPPAQLARNPSLRQRATRDATSTPSRTGCREFRGPLSGDDFIVSNPIAHDASFRQRAQPVDKEPVSRLRRRCHAAGTASEKISPNAIGRQSMKHGTKPTQKGRTRPTARGDKRKTSKLPVATSTSTLEDWLEQAELSGPSLVIR